jgi:hypothetical protein
MSLGTPVLLALAVFFGLAWGESWAMGSPLRQILWRKLRRAKRWLRPTPYLASVAIGFLIAACAGHLAASLPLYRHFSRFHERIGPATHFYPTASQIRRLALDSSPPGRRLVMVGGSSVTYGSGQPPDAIWTQFLQRHLGDGYAVLNFGAPGGRFTDFGAVAFQLVARDRPNALFVADVAPYDAGDINHESVYRYLLWDAYYKHLLQVSPARLAQIREVAIAQWFDAKEVENQLRGLLDSWTFATDLWTTCAYRYGSTIWTPGTAEHPWGARRWWKEKAVAIEDFQTRMKPHARENLAAARGFSSNLFEADGQGGWRPIAREIERVARQIDQALPPELTSRTIVLLVWNNPYFLDQLAPSEKERNQIAYAWARREWERRGYTVTDLGLGYAPEDYVDRVHLMPEGGEKLSSQLEPLLRNLGARVPSSPPATP